MEHLLSVPETFTSVNPATGKVIETFEGIHISKLKDTAQDCHDAYLQWKRNPLHARVDRLKKLSSYLTENEDRLAHLITTEMGKPLKEAKSEIQKCALCCDYYAEYADDFLRDQRISTKLDHGHVQTEVWVSYQPIGVVLAIMPWNFPFWQVFRCAVPALTAGNTVILKHAANVSRCALEIETAFRESGYPENTFKTVLASRDQIPALIKHEAVKAVSLTGSVGAGKQVAALAGAEIKKTVLELGGSDPYIILEDADLDLAAEKCAESRLLNAGQSCISAKRFIVVAKVADAFIAKFSKAMAAKKSGDPQKTDTQIGPLARGDLRDALHRQVQESIAKGAVCILGGKIPSGEGFYYPATILTKVTKGMPAYDEELFGPVASVMIAEDETDALRIANDSPFGLGGGIFTKNIEHGKVLIREQLEAGFCVINDFVRSDPSAPFGGIKMSGYGRELADFGIREFVNIKTLKAAYSESQSS